VKVYDVKVEWKHGFKHEYQVHGANHTALGTARHLDELYWVKYFSIKLGEKMVYEKGSIPQRSQF